MAEDAATSEPRAGAPEALPMSRWVVRRGNVVVALALLAAAAFAAVELANRQRVVVGEWRKLLSAMADEQEAAVESFVDQTATDASIYAAFPSVRAAVANDPSRNPDAEGAGHLRGILEVGRRGWGLVSLSVVRSAEAVPRAIVGEEPSKEAYALLAQGNEPTSRIGLVDSPRGPRLLVAAPVTAEGGGAVRGWVVLLDDPKHDLWKVLRREPAASRTGESLLVRREGENVVFLSPLRHVNVTERLDPGLLAARNLAARQALDGPERFGEFRDYRGERVFAAVRQLEKPGWGLVVKIDRAEALAELTRYRVLALLALLSLALALVSVLRLARSTERLRATAELKRVDERHRTVLARVRDAVIWVRPADGRILAANRAAEELWGFSHDELLSRSVDDLVAGDGREAARQWLAAGREGGVLYRARHRRKDGSLVRVEVSSNPLVLDGERVFVSVVRDVTESEAALERVRLLNRVLRTMAAVDKVLVDEHEKQRVLTRTCEEVVETGGFLVAWYGVPDEAGRIVPVASAGRTEGYLEEAVIVRGPGPLGRGPTGSASREGRTVFVNDWRTDPTVGPWRQAGLRRGFRSSAACPVRCGEKVCGVLNLYSGEPGAFDADVVLLLEELARDLGLALELIESGEQRRRAEDSLAASEARYRMLFEENPGPMWVYDVESLRFLAVNRMAVDLYGWTREEFLGMTIREIRPPEDMPDLDRTIRPPGVGRRRTGPWRHRRKDGTSLLVEIVSHEISFEGRQARLVLADDVTKQVAAEEEIRTLNAELEQRVERRTEELLEKTRELEAFAHSISHDLRAPLRAIDGFSRMVEEDHAGRLDGEGRRLLGLVRDSARRMARLIDDLLSFSRASRHELRKSLVDVGDLVRSVLADVVPEAERERTEVTVGELPPVKADPSLLRQVFVNLLSNAVKFSATRPRRLVSVTGRREEGRVVYEVADNGVGFDMRYAGKLFGVFQRLHGREFEGTGVGLALVERILARHGGTIGAEAELDRGARFTISLPDPGGEA